ncbi:hypothetical protein [Helicobacter sp. UBA3407]|uniref:hypothetical protein n=1 Tax=Helicobacter TaxID=209 RepID=UPI002633EA15|nr:hypothetical protein [Helicobacter sp. UBA3407]
MKPKAIQLINRFVALKSLLKDTNHKNKNPYKLKATAKAVTKKPRIVTILALK